MFATQVSPARQAHQPWLAHAGLLAGFVGMLSFAGVILLPEFTMLEWDPATVFSILILAPFPLAFILSGVAYRTAPLARGEAAVGMLLSLLGLMMLSCHVMMMVMMATN